MLVVIHHVDTIARPAGILAWRALLALAIHAWTIQALQVSILSMDEGDTNHVAARPTSGWVRREVAADGTAPVGAYRLSSGALALAPNTCALRVVTIVALSSQSRARHITSQSPSLLILWQCCT